MEIHFADSKLQKILSDDRQLLKKFGTVRAKKIMQRFTTLQNAHTLSDVPRVPPDRCHELIGNRRGQLSVDLDHPYRLLFSPLEQPPPTKPDGGLDWTKVTGILIIEIEDTHE